MYMTEFDMVYISYDEPNAEKHWADLRRKAPWAIRVHGVKGFDAAHKAAADAATTSHFITVDADNLVEQSFIESEIDDKLIQDGNVLSFASKNNINGLVYGNGGLKIWPKKYVDNMEFHESEEGEGSVDFCWADEYKQKNILSSENFQNGSAYQSFRAGFREGVKMSLDRGDRVLPEDFLRIMVPDNLTRLKIWCTVGRDVEFGDWAVYGARLGAYKTICTDWDFTEIRDYDWFAEYWDNISEEVSAEVVLGRLNGLVGLNLVELDAAQSLFFKETQLI